MSHVPCLSHGLPPRRPGPILFSTMKRFTSVLIAVILGAFATGIGTVPFLVLANQDRQRLGDELQLTKTKATATELEKQRIADQANQKVKEANAEVQKAQLAILEAQEDEKLLATSDRLPTPQTHELAKWNSAISLTLGISFSTPKQFSVDRDDASAFTLVNTLRSSTSTNTVPSILVEPYSEESLARRLNSFASSTPVNLVAGGKLLRGTFGTLLNGSDAYLFQVRSSAKTTRVIWMQDIDLTSSVVRKILSSIQYQ